MANPWFKMYHKIMFDPAIQVLSFEDQRHYVWVLCIKCEGLLDKDFKTKEIRERVIAARLGVSVDEAPGIRDRLAEWQLIDKDWQPANWAKYQQNPRKPGIPDAEDDLEGYKGYVYFIGPESGDTVKIGYSKNPWARLRDLQTATTEKLRVIATVRTTESTEFTTHELFAEQRIKGEWFSVDGVLSSVIKQIKSKKIKDVDSLHNYVATTVAGDVATTKEEDKEEDKEEEYKNTKRFKRPTVEQISDYMTERGCHDPPNQSTRFFDHYESNGWRVGKTPMKDWKATVRNWLRRNDENNRSQRNPGGNQQPKLSAVERGTAATAQWLAERQGRG